MDATGDFYDLFPLSDDCWEFFLGDVCGKGAAAAAVTSLTRYSLRAAAVFNDEPVQVLHNLNSVCMHEYLGQQATFCTVVFGVLTRAADGFDVTMTTGGHLPPILLRRAGTASQLSALRGNAVGIASDPQFGSLQLI
ncbi:hypothetical protein BEL07_28710 [Mycolicibacterium grossiae]|uniref:PPM-type phosphatase domain-containing protein n=1 Tax=Mycolicibacterium grossiae TaxID=1552759 RepID=A0A1E8PW85_9MYCO|nr:PP2C family protein-serine/threonine phosphatase [Mycolicibacterium grossiae]OFJ50357.1 hypothetical protein BEL07_28710 [Mycolicibacterium grossiae]